MLNVYHSNRLEALFAALAEVIAAPLADPFTPERIVVQNQGMARWLALRLAERQGVAANLEFPLPASFVWEQFQAQLVEVPRDSAFDRETLLWRVMALLPGLLEEPAMAPLRRYLAGDHAVLKRYQLAARVADLFDQYLVFRPDLIAAWEAGAAGESADERWQARLWRALTGEGEPLHRVRLLRRFLERAAGDGLDPVGLPERVCVFGLSALAPAHLEVLAVLAQFTEVHLFVLNPSLSYWGDIVAERDLSRLRDLWRRHGKPDASGYYEVGHPLLASLGKQGRDFLDQLHAYPCDDLEAFAVPRGERALAVLQRDILYLRRRGPGGEPVRPLAADDDSVQIHSCHGPMREVQVLHDRLLDLLERLPGLSAQDVVVMAPDIDAYASYIDAVFSAVPRERHIPWAVADRTAAGEQPLVQALLALFDLPDSRLAASEVLGLLEQAPVRRRWGLGESDFERIRQWVAEANIRWGADEAMRAGLGLPASRANTWAFGLERLLLGYAMVPDAPPFAGILPHAEVEGGEAALVGALADLLAALNRWREQLARPCPAREWPGRVNRLLDELLLPDADEEAALQALRDALEGLAREAGRAGLEEPLERAVVREYVAGRLQQPSGSERFLTGRVTFCNMVPMRSVPFRVVCLLGMNDRDYPRAQHPPGFDLIAAAPRRGDRSRREDDRYLFLEALLSAREVFYVSYVGRDLRDNSAKVPSVLVSELLDTLEQGFSAAGGLPARLVTEHPLQPFARRCFGGDRRLFSYADEWLPEADAGRTEQAPFFPAPLPQAEPEWRELDLATLLRFFRHPTRFLLRERLRLELDQSAVAVADEESFDIDGLEAWFLRDETLERLLAGGGIDACRARALAAGALPAPPFGELLWQRQTDHLEAFAGELAPRLGALLEPLELDWRAAGLHLSGWLRGVGPDGLLRYRPGSLKPRDRLGLWLEHLALNLLAPQGAARHSEFVAEDRVLRLPPVADAAERLGDLLALYWDGLHRPLPLFPELAWEYVTRLEKESPEGALARAAALWERQGTDPYVATAFRGGEPLGAEFMDLAERVFAPLLAICEETQR